MKRSEATRKWWHPRVDGAKPVQGGYGVMLRRAGDFIVAAVSHRLASKGESVTCRGECYALPLVIVTRGSSATPPPLPLPPPVFPPPRFRAVSPPTPLWCSPRPTGWRCFCVMKMRGSMWTLTAESLKTWCYNGERCPPLLVGCGCFFHWTHKPPLFSFQSLVARLLGVLTPPEPSTPLSKPFTHLIRYTVVPVITRTLMRTHMHVL